MNTKPIPRVLFSCSDKYCAREVSYHADQLWWYDAERRWVCDCCWEELPAFGDGVLPQRGLTLDEYIRDLNPRSRFTVNLISGNHAGSKPKKESINERK